jgi:hypothetical protein
MSYQSPTHFAHAAIDAGRQLHQLARVLSLVEEIAGRADARQSQAMLVGDTEISASYSDALPIRRRRFDALAAETAAWSAAGVQALLAAGEKRSPAAAKRLGDELRKALGDLKSLLRQ